MREIEIIFKSSSFRSLCSIVRGTAWVRVLPVDTHRGLYTRTGNCPGQQQPHRGHGHQPVSQQRQPTGTIIPSAISLYLILSLPSLLPLSSLSLSLSPLSSLLSLSSLSLSCVVVRCSGRGESIWLPCSLRSPRC